MLPIAMIRPFAPKWGIARWIATNTARTLIDHSIELVRRKGLDRARSSHTCVVDEDGQAAKLQHSLVNRRSHLLCVCAVGLIATAVPPCDETSDRSWSAGPADAA
jgi:hypothetical protein